MYSITRAPYLVYINIYLIETMLFNQSFSTPPEWIKMDCTIFFFLFILSDTIIIIIIKTLSEKKGGKRINLQLYLFIWGFHTVHHSYMMITLKGFTETKDIKKSFTVFFYLLFLRNSTSSIFMENTIHGCHPKISMFNIHLTHHF